MHKPVETVRSGDQLVTPTGRWDRVYGVERIGDTVVVNSDAVKREYPAGTLVEVV